jgi:hypothetical protein
MVERTVSVGSAENAFVYDDEDEGGPFFGIDTDGDGNFDKLFYNMINQMVTFEHREDPGVEGGEIFYTGVPRIRPITHVPINNIEGFSVNTRDHPSSKNIFVPAAGTYIVECEQVIADVIQCRAWIENTNTSEKVAVSLSGANLEAAQTVNAYLRIYKILEFNGSDPYRIFCAARYGGPTAPYVNLGKPADLHDIDELYMVTSFIKLK